MILAIDVHYKEDNKAKIVGVLFAGRKASEKEVVTTYRNNVAAYESGQFYKRELPCILQLINSLELDEIEFIIVDGHVFIDDDKSFGLGGYLWEALNEKTPIVGVAKRSFHSNKNTVKEVYRGASKNPLFVSSIGISLDEASKFIQEMNGDYRIPTILRELDRITKTT